MKLSRLSGLKLQSRDASSSRLEFSNRPRKGSSWMAARHREKVQDVSSCFQVERPCLAMVSAAVIVHVAAITSGLPVSNCMVVIRAAMTSLFLHFNSIAQRVASTTQGAQPY